MRSYIFFLISLIFSVQSIGQQFHFKQYSLKEGLSRSGVYDILQDNKGFLWVATEGGGLCKFDGYNFKTYTRFNGLAAEKIRVIFEDDSGIIWLGTTNGLSYYDQNKFISLTVNNGITDNFIRSIAQDHEGNIWVGTNRGISIIDGNEKEVSKKLKTNFSLPHKKVRSLQAQGEIMWIGTDEGLCKYENDQIEVISTEDGLASDLILSLFIDKKNQLWVGTEGGLNKISNNSIQEWTTENGLIADRVRTITEDHLGNIWVGTSQGISIFNSESFINLNKQNGLPNERIRCFATDSFNNVWIGTFFGGIMRFNHQDFIAYTPTDGLVSNQILSIAEDEQGGIIVGTYDGVSKLKITNEKLVETKTLTTKEGLSNNTVKAIFKDDNNFYWYGTDKGITIIKDNKIRYIDKEQGLKNDEITVISKFNDTYWIGTKGGVGQITTDDYSNFSVEFINHEDGLPGNSVSAIQQDQSGSIWVSFSDGELCTFDNNRFLSPILPQGINEITTFNIDSTGKFWIGTNGNGLYHGYYENQAFDLKNIAAPNNINSNYIFSLVIKDSVVWIGHENGLDLMTIKNDSNFNVQYYGPERGFFGLQNNLNAAFIDRQGNGWFGTVNGLFSSKDNSIKNLTQGQNSINYIQSIKINGKSVNWEDSQWTNGVEGVFKLPKKLALPYNQNNVSFQFIGLNYVSPTNLMYSWKLEGLDTEWKTETANNYMTYTNLYPGDYSFLLRSSDEHGAIINDVTRFDFTIEKPWWETWLFRIFAALFSIALVFLVVRLRTRQLRRKQHQLEDTITLRTTEISRQKEELEIKNNEITDSIIYSRRIQRSILPSQEALNMLFDDYFVFYEPKDIISGDFYWVQTAPDNPSLIYFGVADCTGHGIPGAMVSLVGTKALNNSLKEIHLKDTAKILDHTNKILLETFTDDESGEIVKDGMDIAICSIDYSKDEIAFEFSGANNPVWITRKETADNLIIDGIELVPNLTAYGYKLFEIKGNKQPIGYFEKHVPFDHHSGKLVKGDRIYLTSDGYADQFGGEKGKKFKYKALKNSILSLQKRSIKEQENHLKAIFHEWKGDLEQLDDVCLMAMEV